MVRPAKTYPTLAPSPRGPLWGRDRMAEGWEAGGPSEVSLALAQLHGRIGGLVVHARGAALGDGGHRGLGDDALDRVGFGCDGAGAGDVADGAEAHAPRDDRFAGARRR